MPFLTVHLPTKGKTLVLQGQEIEIGDPLFDGGEVEQKSLSLARLLKVKPQKVKKLLLKKIGDEVAEGEIIAQKTSLLSKRKIKAPQSGSLEKLDEESGILTIKTSGEKQTLKAQVAGRIREIKGKEEIVIEYKGILITAEKGMGPKKEGEIVVLKDSQASLFHLNQDLAGKIIAAKKWSRGSLSKVKAIGVEAVLGQEIEGEDFLKRGAREAIPFLGFKEANFTLLIFSPDNFKDVLKYDGLSALAWGEGKSLLINNK